uniref:F-box domain-containing protein n=1 Tax=Aegilops tauschii TaxID=37682 RepID=N1QST3_AEGTA
MAGEDRLSGLHDNLLRRVLHFVPAKEASSTTALSRRWRTALWRSSGAVNLETCVQNHRHGLYSSTRDEAFYSGRDAFVSAALAALDAADGGHVVDALLCHPAARRAEEFRLVAEGHSSEAHEDREICWSRVGVYRLTVDVLPLETLRVLEITNCKGLGLPKAAAAVALPRLSSLRLRYCVQSLGSLQWIIDAAPVLSAVCLESVQIDDHDINDYYYIDDDEEEDDPPLPKEEDALLGLSCPAATLLVLERCMWKKKHYMPHRNCSDNEKPVALVAAEIHAPRLHRFRYKGLLRPFSFSPQPPELQQVDLEFFPDTNHRDNDPDRDLATFWQLVGSFTSAKDMKLSIKLEAIAVVSKARQAELLPAFSSLKRLELHGVHGENVKKAALGIANLLRCCSALRDLRINLTTEGHHTSKNHEQTREFLKRKFRSSRDNPVDRFDCGCNSEEGHDEAISSVAYDEVSEIPALSRRSFECLQSSLSRVGLQFRFEKLNCLGVKLIKFFAENAMVLEEIHIDSGNGRFCRHVHRKIETCITHSSKRRNQEVPSFAVLTLKR